VVAQERQSNFAGSLVRRSIVGAFRMDDLLHVSEAHLDLPKGGLPDSREQIADVKGDVVSRQSLAADEARIEQFEQIADELDDFGTRGKIDAVDVLGARVRVVAGDDALDQLTQLRPNDKILRHFSYLGSRL